MSLTAAWVHMFFRNPKLFRHWPGAEDATWLSLGTLDYEVAPSEVRHYGFNDEEKQNALIRSRMTDYRLHKELNAALFAKLGFGRYRELDINDRADLAWDMNQPIPQAHHGQYDFIYDGGTLEHIFNPFQGCVNVLRMAKIGGRIAHSQGVSDMTDHGYWTFNPGFLIDFYTSNGCELLDIFLLDLDGNEYRFERKATNGSGAPGYVSPRSTRLAGMQLLRHGLYPPPEKRDKFFLRAIDGILSLMFGRRVTGLPSYSVIGVFRKVRDVGEIALSMQPNYAGDSILER